MKNNLRKLIFNCFLFSVVPVQQVKQMVESIDKIVQTQIKTIEPRDSQEMKVAVIVLQLNLLVKTQYPIRNENLVQFEKVLHYVFLYCFDVYFTYESNATNSWVF